MAKSKKPRLRLRPKPSRPVRMKNKYREMDIDSFSAEHLLELLNELKGQGIDMSKAHVEVEAGDYSYGGSAYAYLKYKSDETDEEYEIRLNHYKKSMASYNKWYKKNEATIKDRIALDKKEAEEAAKKKAIKEEKMKKSRIKLLEKELLKLKEGK